MQEKWPYLYAWFKYVKRTNIEGSMVLNFYFLNLACSQFWLNLLVDHSHFESFFITSGSGTDYHSTVAALTLINYTIFRIVENFKNLFFQRTEICEGK